MPLFYYSLLLKLDSDNRYEVVYRACQQNRDVWYSLRLGLMKWPVPPLQ